MLVGTEDKICPYSRAVETASIIGEGIVNFETIQGKDHGYFASANDESFMSLLISHLQVPSDPEDTIAYRFANVCKAKHD